MKEEIILEFEIIKDILSVLGNVINGLSGIIMGLSFGFLSAPTALGYCAGIIGMLAFKTVIPINIQGETIVLAGSVGKNFRERISIVFYSGVIMVILGGLGLLQRIVDFAGSSIISGMEAGVGIIVIRVAIDLIKESKKTGAVSLVSAFAAYFLTKDLNWTLVISMAASIACFLILNKGPMEEVKEESKFKFFKPVTNFNVIRGALALACLSIGTVAAACGAGNFIVNIITPMLSNTGTFGFLAIVFVFGVIVNFLLTPMAAMSSIAPLLTGVALGLGVSPMATTYAFYLGLDQLILPYEIGTYLIFFSMGYVSLKDFAKTSAVKMAVSTVFTIAIMIHWWMFVVKIV